MPTGSFDPDPRPVPAVAGAALAPEAERPSLRQGRLRLGFLTHLDNLGSPATVYRQTLELVEAAELLGFDSVWVAARHFNAGFAGAPSPLVFLAAAAERTRRIRLGTAVVALPFEHPLRLAEDAAVLDALSGGRLELGVGSGPFPSAWAAFGLDPAERRSRYRATLDRLREALRGAPLTSSGEVVLHPPATGLVSRLWQATSSPEVVAATAAAGDGLQLARHDPGGPPGHLFEHQLELLDVYERNWAGTGEPRVLLSRTVFPARDRDAAIKALRPGIERWVAPFVAQGRYPRSAGVERYLSLEYVNYGAVDDVCEALRRDPVLPRVTDLVLGFQPWITEHERALHLLQVLARELAPRLGWRPAAQATSVESRRRP